MTTYQRNGYDDSDAQQIIEKIEELEAQKATVMAEARGKCSGIANQIKNAFAEAKEVNVPLKSLRGIIKRRKLERKIEAIEAGIPEEEVEIYEDMTGQFSFLSPSDDANDIDEPDKVDPKDAVTKREQAEGAAVLSKVVKH